MTHAQAVRMVRGVRNLSRRKVGNNTHAEILPDGSVGITLHRTMIVVIHPDDSVTLNSGGWQTVTTKARMNEFAENCVYQSRGTWFVRVPGNAVIYFDGMTIPADRRMTQEACCRA